MSSVAPPADSESSSYLNEDGFWTSRLLAQFGDIRHGVTSREFGTISMRRGTGNAEEGRARAAAAIGFEWEDVVFLDVANGSDVAVVEREGGSIGTHVYRDLRPRISVERFLGSGFDGAISRSAGVFLAVCVADCAPVFIFDQKRRVVALAHAGLSGAVCGVARSAVETMRKVYDCRPADLVAAIGPCISSNELDVSGSRMWNEVLEPAGARERVPAGTLIHRDGHVFFDIIACVRRDLIEQGVPASQVEASRICTVDQQATFFSDYAAARTSTAMRAAEGRALAIIGLGGGGTAATLRGAVRRGT